MWWHKLVTPVLGRLRQEDYTFETGLGFTARLCLKKQKETKTNLWVSANVVLREKFIALNAYIRNEKIC
jgi:hypothetical protein